MNGWTLAEDGKSIFADYVMEDFPAAVEFIGKIAALAEQEDHHPDLHLTRYRNLRVVFTTHSAGGLSDKDHALAAKIDGLPKRLRA